MARNSAVQRVFLSSTAQDLQPYRAAILKGFSKAEWMEVVAQEDFGILPDSPADVCREKVAASDIFVGIIGHYRGTEIEGDYRHRSYTEYEYDAAVDLGRPRFMCVQPETSLVDQRLRDDDERHARQLSFRKRIRDQHVVGQDFDSPDALAFQVHLALYGHLWRLTKSQTAPLKEAIKTGRGGISASGTGGGLLVVPEGNPSALTASIIDPELIDQQQAASTPIAGALTELIVDGYLPRNIITADPSELSINVVEGLLRQAGDDRLKQSRKPRILRPFLRGNAISLKASSSRYYVHLSVIIGLHDDAGSLAALQEAEAISPLDLRSKTQMGNLLMRTGRYEEALVLFSNLPGDEADKKATSAKYSNIGTIHRFLGNIGMAIEYHEKSLVLERELERVNGIAIQLLNLAMDRRALGDLQGAAENVRDAMPLLSQAANLAGVAGCNVDLALLSQRVRSMGDPCGYLRTAYHLYEAMSASKSIEAVKALQAELGCS